MKIQKEGGRVLNLPDKLASRLIAKGRFKSTEETFEKPEKKVRKSKKVK